MEMIAYLLILVVMVIDFELGLVIAVGGIIGTIIKKNFMDTNSSYNDEDPMI